VIRSLEIKDPGSTPIGWLDKVEALGKPQRFEFRPGLNVLWGRNGSGKTTIIKLLSRLLHCEQGGVPMVTEESIRTLFERSELLAKHDMDFASAVSVDHDGQGVRHFDPSVAVGLMGGGASFDWDFGRKGIFNAMFKGSAGQVTMFRFEELMTGIVAGKVPAVEWKMKASMVNDFWQARLKVAETFLSGHGDKGQPTVLLDEPERSYDVNTQVGLWRFLRATAPTTQYIVASHCFFALQIPEAHYIELSPAYLSGCVGALKLLSTWSQEKPEAPTLPQDDKPTPKRTGRKSSKAERAR
jgi:energy-coupling factor transporter ATP-binding protein EcfA2